MDRVIEVKVNGHYLEMDSRNAGVQGEGNATGLRMTFDAGWDGYAKTITWWDARGENPTPRLLTADLLEDMVESIRTYMTLIPPEALTVMGECMFAIDGYINGKRQRSVYGNLVVKGTEAGDDIIIETPTPSQIEQIQVQIDTILEDMQERAIRAENAAQAAEESKSAAQEARDDILNMSVSAEDVSPYKPASVTKTSKHGVVNLHFEIPHGKGGVYVGSGEMPEAYEVQVNPEGIRVVDYVQSLMDEAEKQIDRVKDEGDAQMVRIGDAATELIETGALDDALKEALDKVAEDIDCGAF